MQHFHAHQASVHVRARKVSSQRTEQDNNQRMFLDKHQVGYLVHSGQCLHKHLMMHCTT